MRRPSVSAKASGVLPSHLQGWFGASQGSFGRGEEIVKPSMARAPQIDSAGHLSFASPWRSPAARVMQQAGEDPGQILNLALRIGVNSEVSLSVLSDRDTRSFKDPSLYAYIDMQGGLPALATRFRMSGRGWDSSSRSLATLSCTFWSSACRAGRFFGAG